MDMHGCMAYNPQYVAIGSAAAYLQVLWSCIGQRQTMLLEELQHLCVLIDDGRVDGRMVY